MDLSAAALLDNLGPAVTLMLVALAVITDKLVWHTRLKAAEERAQRWEKIAVDALLGAQAGVKAAEVVADIVSSLPDPAKKE